ncbi:FkbM family methyltransferase [Novosphingobium sp.]|uniref:FkbM family methyltransferase n=1 Tax=Novosphingobium sp. TaxID=1874826 RepID=UPI0026270B2C|nr:FkbM family methyltransferase [Novosphingobium sp.]
MDYFAFADRNLRAVEAARLGRFTSEDIGDCHARLGYRGFVHCVAAEGEPSFVMFTNADDVVAGHYHYVGPASFETGTLKVWSHLARRSSWIYDVGSFTGVFALAALAANPNCRVMAFEPSFVTYSRLLVNIYANGFDGQIAPLRAGLGSGEAELELRHSSGVYVMSSDETFVQGKVVDPWFTEKVPVLSLDHLLSHQDDYRQLIVLANRFEGVDLIKIDVEGFEAEVLKGMRGTIDRYHPTVIVEVLDNNNEFLDLPVLNARIEDLLDLFGPGYRVLHIAETSGAFTDEIKGRNHLFIHDSKVSLLSDYPAA